MKTKFVIPLVLIGLVSSLVARADGEKEKPAGDKPRPEAREGDRPAPPREADRPPVRREGERPMPRDGERPPLREGDRPEFREGDRPALREGDRPFPPPRREGDRPPPREGEPRPDGPPPYRPDGPPPREGFEGDPELRELTLRDQDLERQSFVLARRVREASGVEKEQIRKQLAEVVEEHFSTRQELRKHQIDRMTAELNRLKEQVESRNAAKAEILQRRLRELTGEQGELGF